MARIGQRGGTAAAQESQPPSRARWGTIGAGHAAMSLLTELADAGGRDATNMPRLTALAGGRGRGMRQAVRAEEPREGRERSERRKPRGDPRSPLKRALPERRIAPSRAQRGGRGGNGDLATDHTAAFGASCSRARTKARMTNTLIFIAGSRRRMLAAINAPCSGRAQGRQAAPRCFFGPAANCDPF